MKTYSNDPEELERMFETGYMIVKVVFIFSAIMAAVNLIYLYL
jgi:nitrogen fixation protein FixH